MTKSCFVIGPIGDRFAPPGSDSRTTYEDALQVLEEIIEPACLANDMTVIRADQITSSGDINEQVFRHLRDDEVVIADVSGGNANVMYELGARHTLNKLTIQIGEYRQLPFDIRSIRTIQFSRSRRGLIDARNELEQLIATGLAEGAEELPLYRVWSRSDRPPVRLLGEQEEGGAEPGQQEGEAVGGVLPLVDGLAIAEGAFPEFMDVAADISTQLEDIGALLQDATDAAAEADLRSGTAAARLVVLGKLAQDLDDPTAKLESLVNSYDDVL
jgi:hypothetical protein